MNIHEKRISIPNQLKILQCYRKLYRMIYYLKYIKNLLLNVHYLSNCKK